jgi:hypothetical protein
MVNDPMPKERKHAEVSGRDFGVFWPARTSRRGAVEHEVIEAMIVNGPSDTVGLIHERARAGEIDHVRGVAVDSFAAFSMVRCGELPIGNPDTNALLT